MSWFEYKEISSVIITVRYTSQSLVNGSLVFYAIHYSLTYIKDFSHSF